MALVDSSSSTTLYGEFPTLLISQRAAAAQATSLITAASTAYNSAFVTAQNAALVEVMNTFIALGIWKGSL